MAATATTGRFRKLLLLGLCLVIVAGVVLVRPVTVEYRIWQARRAWAKQDAETALAWLELAERLDPNRSKTQFWMARVYRRLGQMDRAHERLTRASELGHPAQALRHDELLTLAQSGKIPLAHPEVLALMMDPGADAPDLYEALVQGALQTFRLGDAMSLLEAWEGDQAANSQPPFYRGLVLSHQDDWLGAVGSFRRALALAPERDDVRLHLARALRERYQYRQAIRHYRRYLVNKEHDPEALLGLAMCLDAMGKSDEAREKYALVLAMVPDHGEARLAIGELELSYGKAEQALRWLEPAAEQSPYEYNLRLALAWALQTAGQPARAREHFEFAVRAQAAANQLKHLVRRAAQDPENVELRYAIGTTLLRYGPPEDGVVWLESVLQLQPDHQRARDALTDYYSGLSPPATSRPASSGPVP